MLAAGMSPVAESPTDSHAQTPTPPRSVAPEVSGDIQQPAASGFTRLQSPPVQAASGDGPVRQSDVSVLAGELQQHLALDDGDHVSSELDAANGAVPPEAAREPLTPLEALLHLCNQQVRSSSGAVNRKRRGLSLATGCCDLPGNAMGCRSAC